MKATLDSQHIIACMQVVSKDKMKVALTGVLVEVKKDCIIYTGCDGHALYSVTVKNEVELENEFTFIFPPTKKAELKTKELYFPVELNDKHLTYSVNGKKSIVEVIDERYPDYDSVSVKPEFENIAISTIGLCPENYSKFAKVSKAYGLDPSHWVLVFKTAHKNMQGNCQPIKLNNDNIEHTQDCKINALVMPVRIL